MSIIEQAARRLEELRRSGIEVPSLAAPGAHAAGGGEAMPARVARLVEDVPPAGGERQPVVRAFAPLYVVIWRGTYRS